MIIKNFSLNIKTSLSGLSFSFDELIMETKNLFENEGIPGFLTLLISFIDNMVIEHWKASREAKCSNCVHLNRSGKRSKTMITSLGNISFEWILLKCKNLLYPSNKIKVKMQTFHVQINLIFGGVLLNNNYLIYGHYLLVK